MIVIKSRLRGFSTKSNNEFYSRFSKSKFKKLILLIIHSELIEKIR